MPPTLIAVYKAAVASVTGPASQALMYLYQLASLYVRRESSPNDASQA